jgi:hypothetical protein
MKADSQPAVMSDKQQEILRLHNTDMNRQVVQIDW